MVLQHISCSTIYKALNGLRDASLHWLNLLSDSIRGVGLVSDEVEPCIYQGIMHGETALLVAYVDDLLLCCQTARSEKLVEKAIGKAVPLKETGLVLPAGEGGGALTFIGRRIQRGATDDSLSIGVDPKFLDTTFVEFSVNKGSNIVPDVAAVLERALTDESMQQPLTAAAYSRFRRALGKLLWMAQSRHDLKLFLSLIGSQQAAPTHGTEMAIKALLRFLYGDVGTCLRLPSPKYEELMIGAARHCILHSFSECAVFVRPVLPGYNLRRCSFTCSHRFRAFPVENRRRRLKSDNWVLPQRDHRELQGTTSGNQHVDTLVSFQFPGCQLFSSDVSFHCQILLASVMSV